MCVKCIIDPPKAAAAGQHLAVMMAAHERFIIACQDIKQCPVPLTDDEWQTVMQVSQEQCELADTINDKIREWTDKLCEIARRHSHGGDLHKHAVEG